MTREAGGNGRQETTPLHRILSRCTGEGRYAGVSGCQSIEAALWCLEGGHRPRGFSPIAGRNSLGMAVLATLRNPLAVANAGREAQGSAGPPYLFTSAGRRASGWPARTEAAAGGWQRGRAVIVGDEAARRVMPMLAAGVC